MLGTSTELAPARPQESLPSLKLLAFIRRKIRWDWTQKARQAIVGQKKWEETMEPIATGTAIIVHAITGVEYEIDAYDLDWEMVGSDEENMGERLHWEASLEHPDLGKLTWNLWEYPVGVEDSNLTEHGDHRLVSDLRYSLHHTGEETDRDDDHTIYYAEEDPRGVSGSELTAIDDDQQVGYLTHWFLSYYEDPAQETPYNGREGGYLYVHGGPFNANDELYKEFGQLVSDAVIERAVDIIESDGIQDWAPHPNHPSRVDEGLEYDEDPTPEDILQDLQWRLEAGLEPRYGSGPEMLQRAAIVSLLDLLDQELPPSNPEHGGFGHNNPPADERFSADELAQMSQASIVLRQELAKEKPNAVAVVKEARALKWIQENVSKHSGIMAEEFSKGFGKSAGETAGKAFVGVLVAGAAGLLFLLANLTSAVTSWLSTITLPF